MLLGSIEALFDVADFEAPQGQSSEGSQAAGMVVRHPTDIASQAQFTTQLRSEGTSILEEGSDLRRSLQYQIHQNQNPTFASSVFHDSGYCGSAGDRISILARSVTTSQCADPSIDVDLRISEPTEPQGSLGAADQSSLIDKEYDVRSLISVDDDIQSQLGGPTTPRLYIAEQAIGDFLASLKEIRPLYEESLRILGKHRFINNFRRLLKMYYIDLRPIAKTKLEKATVDILRSRNSRANVAVNIFDAVNTDKEGDDEDKVTYAVDKRKELESWIQQSEFGSPNGDGSVPELDEEDNDEDEHGEEGQNEVDDTQLPNVAEMENFLLTCGDGQPFRELLRNIRVFLVAQDMRSLSQLLSSIPKERIWLDMNNDVSIPNKIKSFVEDATEGNWNWWPLGARMKMLQENQTRLHWICVSFWDFTTKQTDWSSTATDISGWKCLTPVVKSSSSRTALLAKPSLAASSMLSKEDPPVR